MTTEKASEISARVVSEQSKKAVKQKDKEKWLSCFADDAIIEDPRGEAPFDPEEHGYSGKEAISAYWDANIANHTLEVDVKESYDAGKEIVYVESMHITGEKGSVMGEGASIILDCVTTYKINDDGKLVSLRILWELEKAMATLKVP